MKTLLTGALAAGLLLGSAPAAHAHPNYHYLGGCRMVLFQDVTPGGQLGGQDVWNGLYYVDVVATDSGGVPAPPASRSVSCEIRVNGISQGVVLGPMVGTGFGAVVATGSVQFTAAVTDDLELCERVVVGGEAHGACHGVTYVP